MEDSVLCIGYLVQLLTTGINLSSSINLRIVGGLGEYKRIRSGHGSTINSKGLNIITNDTCKTPYMGDTSLNAVVGL